MTAYDVVGASWVLRELSPPHEAELDRLERAAAAVGALDLRAVGVDLPGFVPVHGEESARPVPHVLPTVEDTRAFGGRLATLLRAGDLVVLTGPLGAGKTAMTQGIGAALGVQGAVTSPTFVLARVHRGPLPLVHVDAYRLGQDALALDDLDLDADVPTSVTVVEWGAGVAEQLADSWLEVQLTRPEGTGTADPDESPRTVRVVPRGPRWGVVHVHDNSASSRGVGTGEGVGRTRLDL